MESFESVSHCMFLLEFSSIIDGVDCESMTSEIVERSLFTFSNSFLSFSFSSLMLFTRDLFDSILFSMKDIKGMCIDCIICTMFLVKTVVIKNGNSKTAKLDHSS